MLGLVPVAMLVGLGILEDAGVVGSVTTPPCEAAEVVAPMVELGAAPVWVVVWAMAACFIFLPPIPPPTAAAMIITSVTMAIIMIPLLVR